MSDSFFDYLDVFAGFFGALFAWFFGSWDGLIKMLLALCFIDYCTGFISAYFQKKLSSAIGFKGIARKVTMFALVGIAHVIDRELLGQTALLRDAVIFFYLANEGLSVLENSILIGIPVPDVLKSKLLQLQNHDDDKSVLNTEDNKKNIKHEAKKSKWVARLVRSTRRTKRFKPQR